MYQCRRWRWIRNTCLLYSATHVGLGCRGKVFHFRNNQSEKPRHCARQSLSLCACNLSGTVTMDSLSPVLLRGLYCFRHISRRRLRLPDICEFFANKVEFGSYLRICIHTHPVTRPFRRTIGKSGICGALPSYLLTLIRSVKTRTRHSIYSRPCTDLPLRTAG
jgi:hypothetical protein